MKSKAPSKPKYKFSYITAVEVRDVMIEAVKNGGNKVKISYPKANGLQIDIEYTDVKSLFEFAKHFGAIMQTIKPEALQRVRNNGECDFFLCVNCRTTDKTKRDRVFRNLCEYCGVTFLLVNESELEARQMSRAEIMRVREPPPVEEIKKQSPATPVKRKNIIKLKHQK